MTKARCSQQSITIISLIWANMITHNGKQVTLAMRNRKAINLIARNGKAMFGEFSADIGYGYGIDAAAKAVILAEYGSVVWSDVKQYAKAHPQIVEFINQDPHLAASISPNSNKERWLVGDGKSYFNLGKKCTTFPMTSEVKFRVLEHTQEYFSVCCNRKNNNRLQLAGIWEDKVFLSHGTSYSYIHSAYELNKAYIQKYEFTSSATKIWLNDTYLQKEASYTNTLNLLAFARQYDNAIDGICPAFVQMAYINLHEKGHFVPYRDPSTGEMELLDLVTATLATRVGTFTEVIEDKA